MTKTSRETIITALMTLANTHEWNAISLPMIAEQAGVSLQVMREAFPSKGAMLAGFAKMIDAEVLKGTGTDMADETTRDRLLDIMLRSFDALNPYKQALRTIRNHYKTDILGLVALNGVALNSWRYMLAAANIDTEGHLGAVRVQGAALVFVSCFETWLNDTSAGQDQTMAALDKKLKKGEQTMERLSVANKFFAPLCSGVKKTFEQGRGMQS